MWRASSAESAPCANTVCMRQRAGARRRGRIGLLAEGAPAGHGLSEPAGLGLSRHCPLLVMHARVQRSGICTRQSALLCERPHGRRKCHMETRTFSWCREHPAGAARAPPTLPRRGLRPARTATSAAPRARARLQWDFPAPVRPGWREIDRRSTIPAPHARAAARAHVLPFAERNLAARRGQPTAAQQCAASPALARRQPRAPPAFALSAATIVGPAPSWRGSISHSRYPAQH